MNSMSTLQRGRGKGRDPWKIRGFLLSQGLSMSALARRVGTWPQVVQETVRGTRNHSKVLVELERLGCPKNYLYGSEKTAA